MTLQQYAQVLYKWGWLIALLVVIAVVTALSASWLQTPTYRATVTLVINPAAPSQLIPYLSQAVSGGPGGAVERLAASYAEYLRSRTFTSLVIDQLQLESSSEALAGAASTQLVPNTNVFKISVTWPSPVEAQRIANGIAEIFIRENERIQKAELGALELTKEQWEGLEYYRQRAKELRAQRDAVAASTLPDDQKREELARIQGLLGPVEDAYLKWSAAVTAGAATEKTILNTASIVDRAPLPQAPVSPDTRRNALFALIAAFPLAIGLALLLEYLDNTVKTAEDIYSTASLSTLGAIMHFRGQELPLPTTAHTKSPIAEAYRVLRTNLQFSTLDRPARTLLITSTNPLEGKSTTLANLAVVLAQAGKRVIAVDSDLRRPALHRFFQLPNSEGLTNLLLAEEPAVDGALRPTQIEGLKVLTSGPIPPNPVELLGSPRMAALIERLKSEADVVLFDSPPLLAVADACVLGAYTDGAIVVVEGGKMRPEVLRQGKEALSRSTGRILGAVLNKLSERVGYYYYYYYYSDKAPQDGSGELAGDRAAGEQGRVHGARRRGGWRGWLGRIGRR